MSGSPGVVAPSRPVSPAAAGLPSPFVLPLHALGLAGRCALPLILWFSAGEAGRFALLYLGSEISHGAAYQARLIGTVAIFTLIVMLSMVVTTAMFLALRGALWETTARRTEGAGSERFWGSLNRVAPAFAVIYLSWGLHVEDAVEFIRF